MSSITARRLPGPATLEDLLAIPENERRHELIDGVLIETNTLRPDIAGWRRERLAELPSEVPIRLRPDWTCEVLSSNHRNDLVKKKRLYHQHQVPHYWCIAGPPTATSRC